MSEERLKHVAAIHVSNVDKKSSEGDVPVKLCNYTDVYYNDRITGSLDFMPATATRDQLVRFRLLRGDVLLTKDSETADDIGVSALVAEDVPDLVCGYHLAVVRAQPGRADGGYLRWVLASTVARQRMSAAATGVTRFGLRSEAIADLPVPLPSFGRQRAIAHYLDHETSRIDAVIAAKQRMVELLEERLRVAISDATADGHLTAARRIIVLRTTGPRGWGDLVAATGEPFIRSANLRRDDIELRGDDIAMVSAPLSQEAARSRTAPGDVLVGVTGANTGWIGIVRDDFAHGYVSQHVAILRPAECVLPEWLAYSLFSYRVQDQLLGGQYGGTKQQLGLEDLANLVIRLPDIGRQRALVGKLEHAKGASRSAVRILASQIGLLQERRQALITGAVTGQRDIPEAA